MSANFNLNFNFNFNLPESNDSINSGTMKLMKANKNLIPYHKNLIPYHNQHHLTH